MVSVMLYTLQRGDTTDATAFFGNCTLECDSKIINLDAEIDMMNCESIWVKSESIGDVLKSIW